MEWVIDKSVFDFSFLGKSVDYILRAPQASFLVALSGTDDIPGFFKLPDCFAYSVDFLLVDKGQPHKGVPQK